MNPKAKSILIYSTLLIVGLYFLFWGLVKAKAFLAPIVVAALLAMVVLPICRWFEKKGISRGWASLLSDLVILLFFVGLAAVMATQVKSIAQDWPQIQERMEPKIEQLQEFIADKTGFSIQEQNQRIANTVPGSSPGSGQQAEGSSPDENQQQESPDQSSQAEGNQQQEQQQEEPSQEGSQTQQSGGGSGGGGSMLSSAGSFITTFFGFIGTFLLTFVYIFFFLLYRNKFKRSVLKIAPEEKRERSKTVLNESTDVAQNYLFGRLILIIFLAVLYSAGLSISGVKHAILISVLAAVLSLIPYIGNVIGFILALGMAFFSGSGLMGAIGVAITFAIAQFVESYILEPYIVGDKVNLNPVVTIVVVVLGEVVWGVTGMLIAIPALGIAKVLFDHVPVLNPLGYLFGQEDIGDDDDDDQEKDNIFTKTKRWALNKFQSS